MNTSQFQKAISVRFCSAEDLDEEEAALTIDLEDLDGQEHVDILAAQSLCEGDLTDEDGYFFGDLDCRKDAIIAEIKAGNAPIRARIMRELKETKEAREFLEGALK